MKKSLMLIVGLLAFATVSCNMDDDTEYYRYALGVIEGSSSSSFLIKTDGGHKFKALEYPSTFKIEDGKRVLLRYTVVEEMKDAGYDYSVKIASIRDVLTKDIKVADAELRDTLSNDPVTITWLSIGNSFLNVEFSFFGNDTVHYFDLIYDEEKQNKEGFITLNFHHASNDDLRYNKYQGIVRFPLSSIEVEDKDSLMIYFTSRNEDNSTFTTELKYKYGADE